MLDFKITVYNSPPLKDIPSTKKSCPYIREMFLGEREHYMHSQYFAAKNLCPL